MFLIVLCCLLSLVWCQTTCTVYNSTGHPIEGLPKFGNKCYLVIAALADYATSVSMCGDYHTLTDTRSGNSVTHGLFFSNQVTDLSTLPITSAYIEAEWIPGGPGQFEDDDGNVLSPPGGFTKSANDTKIRILVDAAGVWTEALGSEDSAQVVCEFPSYECFSIESGNDTVCLGDAEVYCDDNGCHGNTDDDTNCNGNGYLFQEFYNITAACSCQYNTKGTTCGDTPCGTMWSNNGNVCNGYTCLWDEAEHLGECDCENDAPGVVYGGDCESLRCDPDAPDDECYGGGNCTYAAENATCSCFTDYFGVNCQVYLGTCGGINAGQYGVCSGHGTCIHEDDCDCVGGYYGEECEHWECSGKNETDDTVCGGNGDCVAPEVCDCDPGYGKNEGEWFCGDYTCYGESNDGDVCGDYGSCDGPNLCNCTLYPFAYGDYCELYDCDYEHNDVRVCNNGVGICLPNEFLNDTECVCSNLTEVTSTAEALWGGEHCDVPYCGDYMMGTAEVCNGRGTCTMVPTLTTMNDNPFNKKLLNIPNCVCEGNWNPFFECGVCKTGYGFSSNCTELNCTDLPNGGEAPYDFVMPCGDYYTEAIETFVGQGNFVGYGACNATTAMCECTDGTGWSGPACDVCDLTSGWAMAFMGVETQSCTYQCDSTKCNSIYTNSLCVSPIEAGLSTADLKTTEYCFCFNADSSVAMGLDFTSNCTACDDTSEITTDGLLHRLYYPEPEVGTPNEGCEYGFWSVEPAEGMFYGAKIGAQFMEDFSGIMILAAKPIGLYLDTMGPLEGLIHPDDIAKFGVGAFVTQQEDNSPDYGGLFSMYPLVIIFGAGPALSIAHNSTFRMDINFLPNMEDTAGLASQYEEVKVVGDVSGTGAQGGVGGEGETCTGVGVGVSIPQYAGCDYHMGCTFAWDINGAVSGWDDTQMRAFIKAQTTSSFFIPATYFVDEANYTSEIDVKVTVTNRFQVTSMITGSVNVAEGSYHVETENVNAYYGGDEDIVLTAALMKCGVVATIVDAEWLFTWQATSDLVADVSDAVIATNGAVTTLTIPGDALLRGTYTFEVIAHNFDGATYSDDVDVVIMYKELDIAWTTVPLEANRVDETFAVTVAVTDPHSLAGAISYEWECMQSAVGYVDQKGDQLWFECENFAMSNGDKTMTLAAVYAVDDMIEITVVATKLDGRTADMTHELVYVGNDTPLIAFNAELVGVCMLDATPFMAFDVMFADTYTGGDPMLNENFTISYDYGLLASLFTTVVSVYSWDGDLNVLSFSVAHATGFEAAREGVEVIVSITSTVDGIGDYEVGHSFSVASLPVEGELAVSVVTQGLMSTYLVTASGFTDAGYYIFSVAGEDDIAGASPTAQFEFALAGTYTFSVVATNMYTCEIEVTIDADVVTVFNESLALDYANSCVNMTDGAEQMECVGNGMDMMADNPTAEILTVLVDTLEDVIEDLLGSLTFGTANLVLGIVSDVLDLALADTNCTYLDQAFGMCFDVIDEMVSNPSLMTMENLGAVADGIAFLITLWEDIGGRRQSTADVEGTIGKFRDAVVGLTDLYATMEVTNAAFEMTVTSWTVADADDCATEIVDQFTVDVCADGIFTSNGTGLPFYAVYTVYLVEPYAVDAGKVHLFALDFYNATGYRMAAADFQNEALISVEFGNFPDCDDEDKSVLCKWKDGNTWELTEETVCNNNTELTCKMGHATEFAVFVTDIPPPDETLAPVDETTAGTGDTGELDDTTGAGGLSTGALVGIIVGAVAGVLLVVLVIVVAVVILMYFVLSARKKKTVFPDRELKEH